MIWFVLTSLKEIFKLSKKILLKKRKRIFHRADLFCFCVVLCPLLQNSFTLTQPFPVHYERKSWTHFHQLKVTNYYLLRLVLRRILASQTLSTQTPLNLIEVSKFFLDNTFNIYLRILCNMVWTSWYPAPAISSPSHCFPPNFEITSSFPFFL